MYDKFIKSLKERGTYDMLKNSTCNSYNGGTELQTMLIMLYTEYTQGYIQDTNDMMNFSKNNNSFIKN